MIRSERASISAFVAVVALGLIMVAGMAYDGGRIVAAQATARDLASSAARAGAQEVDLDHLRSTGETRLDPGRALAAAEGFLAREAVVATARVEGASVTVTVSVRQPMLILPVGDRVVSATDTATAVDAPLGAGP